MLTLALALVACDKTPTPDTESGPPLGMILEPGTYAGASVIDVTPEMRVEFRTIRRRLFAGKPTLFDIRIHLIARP